jgi:hypothetical protein
VDEAGFQYYWLLFEFGQSFPLNLYRPPLAYPYIPQLLWKLATDTTTLLLVNMFATLFSVTLFVALAIQGAFADFTINTPSFVQVIYHTVIELLEYWFTSREISVHLLRSPGRSQLLRTTFL